MQAKQAAEKYPEHYYANHIKHELALVLLKDYQLYLAFVSSVDV